MKMAASILLGFFFAASCAEERSDLVQGYVEGEFVYVSSPLAGILQDLSVHRGEQVKLGSPLFALENTLEVAVRDQARAAVTLAEAEFARQEQLFRSGPVARAEFDRARSTRDQDRQRLFQAEWNLAQKAQAAPVTGLVYDTLFRPGEWVPAGRPVVSLLPPANVKVRAFVPEGRVGTLRVGQEAKVSVDGAKEPAVGKISYISPRAEFTPPVIYSRESREKLVFMVELSFPPQTSAQLHPGQPVDVAFGLISQ